MPVKDATIEQIGLLMGGGTAPSLEETHVPA
jgi:hypothetical protein